MLQVGHPAQSFSLPDASMEIMHLSSYRGKKNVVLYFYPRNGSPGCTIQSIDFSDHYPCLANMGKDIDFGDTLMHVSGNVLKDNVGAQVKPYKRVQYLAPGMRSDES